MNVRFGWGLMVVVFLTISLFTVVWFIVPGVVVLPGQHPAFYPAVFLSGGTLMVTLSCILWVESRSLRHDWLRRAASLTRLPDLGPENLLRRMWTRLPDPLEWFFQPLLRSRLGHALQAEWIDSSFGCLASRYLLLLLAAALAGFLLGMRIGGPLLGISFALISPLLPRIVVASRAQAQRRCFGEQLPQLLELLASGMAAGMSFRQSVEFSRAELPQPAKSEVMKLSARLALGWAADTALLELDNERDEEGLHLAVEGLILQRQFGGDMVKMLEQISDLLRERVELEREIRTVSTQGRLSGIVIAALVPASAAFLLAFNPRYIDILFDTIIGQALVVTALILQLSGWAVISRLMRIKY